MKGPPPGPRSGQEGPGGLGLDRGQPQPRVLQWLDPHLNRQGGADSRAVRNHLGTGSVQRPALLPTPRPRSVVGLIGSSSVRRGPGPEHCPRFPWKSHFSEAVRPVAASCPQLSPPPTGGLQHPGPMPLPSPQLAGPEQGHLAGRQATPGPAWPLPSTHPATAAPLKALPPGLSSGQGKSAWLGGGGGISGCELPPCSLKPNTAAARARLWDFPSTWFCDGGSSN